MGPFRKKVDISHICNEITGEPTIIVCVSCDRKIPKVVISCKKNFEDFPGN